MDSVSSWETSKLAGSASTCLPADRCTRDEFDFTESNGFILRVSAGVDLYQEDSPVATWSLQAIDPLTGEVLQDATRGLLRPNNALGEGAGFVTYSVTTRRANRNRPDRFRHSPSVF